MIICLKTISEECFSFNDNVNASLKFLWELGGHLGLQGTRDTFFSRLSVKLVDIARIQNQE